MDGYVKENAIYKYPILVVQLEDHASRALASQR